MDMCGDLAGNVASSDLFCGMFEACEEAGYTDDYDYGGDVDCATLTSCEWEGKRDEFIGDGVCDQWTAGCYNTAICGYDNGDCCEDKCEDGEQNWASCGSNGFYCADPESTLCDPEWNESCAPLPTEAPSPPPSCKSTLIKIMQYDSWGDGWNDASMTVKTVDGAVIYEGTLLDGSEGVVQQCLSDGCYVVDMEGGDWGNEISWEVRPSSGGSLLASGGAPATCTFPVGGNMCANTCNGEAPPPEPLNPDDVDDEDESSGAEQARCMLQHCAIQYADCVSDFMSCLPCLSDYTQSYCSTNGKFEALTKCEQCYCVEGMEASCGDGDGGGGSPSCGPEQIGIGGQAVFEWQTCTSLGGTNNMIKDWDENEFGALDAFESCSHSYANDANHGGKKAEDCMQILLDAATSKETGIINEIASELYLKPTHMCECSSAAWTAVPQCNTFSRFKVLVHETLDACQSLDEIDCDAWREFSDVCQTKVSQTFGNVDFYKRKQCDFVKEGCGGSGAFPAFRKLDCGGEIPKKNWDFWNDYSVGCALAVEDDDEVPVSPPEFEDDDNVKPMPKPEPSPGKDDGGSNTKKGGAAGPVIGVLCTLGVVVGGAVMYKRRSDSNAMGSAYRYRPQRDSSDSDVGSELFSGMNMGVNAGSFKPPSVPQTHNI